MTNNEIRTLSETIVRMRHALMAMGGRGPLKIIVDDKSADAILYYASEIMTHDDGARRAQEPTFLGTINGVEFHCEHPRHQHVVRSLRALLDDQD